MNAKQESALRALVERFNGTWEDQEINPAGLLDGLPKGYVTLHVKNTSGQYCIFVGCSPKGEISS